MGRSLTYLRLQEAVSYLGNPVVERTRRPNSIFKDGSQGQPPLLIKHHQRHMQSDCFDSLLFLSLSLSLPFYKKQTQTPKKTGDLHHGHLGVGNRLRDSHLLGRIFVRDPAVVRLHQSRDQTHA